MAVNCSLNKHKTQLHMNERKIRIVIADNQKLVRQGYRLFLETNEAIEVIGECANGAETIEKADRLSPDIILLDMAMSPVNGFEATRKICQAISTVKIIAIAADARPSHVQNLLRLGAKGYLSKNSSPEEMLEAILAVAKGKTYICKEIKKQMPQDKRNK
jgi:DNA-binding NarL/FixJ family response regulator